jgi:hypothetical protein
MKEKGLAGIKAFKRRLTEKIAKSYFVRFHMLIILSATILSGVICSKIMVLLGVTRMPLRYGIAIVLSYMMFFLFIKLWLLYIGVGRNTRPQNVKKEDSAWTANVLPLPDGSISDAGDAGVFNGLRGGASGGGGAVRGFAENIAGMEGAANTGTGPVVDAAGTAGDAAGGILDAADDSILTVIAIVLLITLALSVFIAGGYLIWSAPAILSDAAFHALLVAGFARKVKQAEETCWETTIFKATWWAFLMVLIFSVAFGIIAQMVFPEAVTIKDFIAFLLKVDKAT